MIPIGWFGVGSGAYADADGVAELARGGGASRLRVDLGGRAPGAHRPARATVTVAAAIAMMDPIPVLAFAAAATERIKLGTGIVILPLRNPVILAKELATIDVLSRGRLLVGIGVGYVPGEYDAIGVPFTTRGRRADDAIDAMRALWSATTSRSTGASSHRSAASSAARSRCSLGGPPILGQWDVDGGAAPGRRPVPGLVRLLPRSRLHPRRDRGARTACRTRSTDRPSWGRSRSASRRHRVPSTPTRSSSTRTSGSHRLVLLQDFGDMAGGPDPAKRGMFLAEMEASAEPAGRRLSDREHRWPTWKSSRRRSTRRSKVATPTVLVADYRARCDHLAQPRSGRSRRGREHGRHRHARSDRRRRRRSRRSCSPPTPDGFVMPVRAAGHGGGQRQAVRDAQLRSSPPPTPTADYPDR